MIEENSGERESVGVAATTPACDCVEASAALMTVGVATSVEGEEGVDVAIEADEE